MFRADQCNFLDTADFHAHILPGADHGCDSVESAIGQLNLASKYMVSRIVATPHFYPQSFSVDEFINRREHSMRLLHDATKSISAPTVICGAEVLMCEHIEKMPGIERLCLGKSNILLLELPQNSYSFDLVRSVKSLISMDFDIVLAHADRYDKDSIDCLIDVGAKIQLNAPSLSSLFIKKHIIEWIEGGYVVCIGSDIHGTSCSHYRKFRSAADKISRRYSYVNECSDSLWKRIVK